MKIKKLSFFLKYCVFLLVLLGAILAPNSNVFGQVPGHVVYDARDGFIDPLVYHGLQDEEGYLWFATAQGVSRYDGQTFMEITHKDGLPDTEVLKLELDGEGKLWFLCANGRLACWDHGKLLHPGNNEELANFDLQKPFLNFLDLGDGRLLFGHRNKVQVVSRALDSAHDGFYSYGDFLGPKDLWMDNNKEAWIVSIESYQTLDGKKIYPPRYNVVPNSSGMVLPDSSGVLVVTREGLVHFSNGKEELVYPFSDSLFCSRIHRLTGTADEIFMATTDGAMRLVKDSSGTYSRTTYFEGTPSSTFFKDREGNFWITTLGASIIKIPSLDITNIYPDKKEGMNQFDAIGIGPDGKVCATDLSNSLMCFDSPTEYKSIDLGVLRKGRARTRQIFSFEGVLWIVHDHNIQALENGKLKTFVYNPKLLFPLGGDRFIVSSHSIVSSVSLNELFTMQSPYLPFLKQNLVFEEKVHALCNGPDSTVFLGAEKGLFHYDGKETVPVSNPQKLQEISISALAYDTNGALWIGTKKEGVFLYKNKELRQWSVDEGLLSPLVTSLTMDENGNPWIGTNEGIVKLHQGIDGEYRMQAYDGRHGLVSTNIQDLKICGDSIWAMAPEGISVFPLDLKLEESTEIPVHISGFWVNDRLVPEDSLSQLLPEQNNIRVQFVGIYFRDPSAITYQYRLVGRDENWHYLSGNEMVFSGLLPGAYTFEVLAMLGDKQLGEGKSISFQIQPRFWQTTWFKVLMGLVFVGLLVLLFRIRMLVFDKEVLLRVVRKLLPQPENQVAPERYHFLKIGGQQVRVGERDIYFIKAAGDYTEVHTTEGKHLVRITMKGIQDDLTTEAFVRVHRSFIVRKDKIEGIQGKSAVVVNGITIPVGRSYKQSLVATVEEFELS